MSPPTTSASGSTEARIAVNLDQWIEGYVVTLGVLGDSLQVKQAVKATVFEAGPQTLADYSFSFRLGERPPELLAFAVVLRGAAFDSIMSLSCSQAIARPPPPPPPSPVRISSAGSGKKATTSSSIDSYGHVPDAEYSESDSSYDPFGSTAPAAPSRSSSRTNKASGGGSPTLLFLTIAALGVALFVAHKAGRLDFMTRSRQMVQVDGSDEKEAIVDAAEAGVNGLDSTLGLNPAEESPKRPYM